MSTTRQKKVLDIITQNHGAIGLKDAMLQAGYDEDTAKRPKNLTESKGFQELVETYLPDERLQQRHRELLEDESNIAVKALDMAYKLKGSYAPDKSINLNVNADIKQDPKARAIGEKYEEELL